MKLSTKKLLARLTLAAMLAASVAALVVTGSLVSEIRTVVLGVVVSAAVLLGPAMVAAKCHEVLSRKEEDHAKRYRRATWDDEGYGE